MKSLSVGLPCPLFWCFCDTINVEWGTLLASLELLAGGFSAGWTGGWHRQARKGVHAMFIDHTKINTMPLILGPLFDRENRPGLRYADTENLVLQYRTDTEALRTLLPECYEPADDPTVR
jgi:hypothetical protein